MKTIDPAVSAYMRTIGASGGRARAKLPKRILSRIGRKAGKASGKARRRNGAKR